MKTCKTFELDKPQAVKLTEGIEVDVVPIVGTGTLAQAIELVKGEHKSKWGDFQAEGVVIKPKVELFNRKGERIITKVKHRDFK